MFSPGLFRYWSIRVYSLLCREYITVESSADCIRLADRIMQGKVRSAGLKSAVELYRGAGLGTRVILARIALKHNRLVEYSTIVDICNRCDRMFHEKI